MTDAFQGTEGGNQLTPSYAYVLSYQDTGQQLFITAWERGVTITGLPASLGGDPQTFDVANVGHGEHGLKAEFDKQPLTLMVTTSNQQLAAYFATAAATRISVAIMRLNSEKLRTGEVLDYAADCFLLNSGLLGAIAFEGQLISAEVIPEPFGANANVPRHYFQRTCGHVLGHPKTCKVDLAAFTHAGTIDEVAPGQKMVTVSFTPPGGVADYFRAGVLIHNPTGQRAGIEWSDGAGAGGKVRLKLSFWNLAFTPGDTISAVAGCRHTVEDCETKFSNLPNYGGFPYVPTRNPALHGVGA